MTAELDRYEVDEQLSISLSPYLFSGVWRDVWTAHVRTHVVSSRTTTVFCSALQSKLVHDECVYLSKSRMIELRYDALTDRRRRLANGNVNVRCGRLAPAKAGSNFTPRTTARAAGRGGRDRYDDDDRRHRCVCDRDLVCTCAVGRQRLIGW